MIDYSKDKLLNAYCVRCNNDHWSILYLHKREDKYIKYYACSLHTCKKRKETELSEKEYNDLVNSIRPYGGQG